MQASVERGYYECGTGSGKHFKPWLKVPGIFPSAHAIWQYDGHFCFVDTNLLQGRGRVLGLTHITGVFIFRVESHESDSIRIDVPNAKLFCREIQVPKGEKPEQVGWQDALKALQDGGITRALMFVDAHRAELGKVQEKLPEGITLCYAGTERRPTEFNQILWRLDRLTKHIAKVRRVGDANDAVKFLLGTSTRLAI